MKKILLFLSFLLMSIGVWGVDVEFTPSSSGGMSSTAGRISGTKNGITIVISNGVNNGSDIRVYRNASMTITSSVGNITNIAFTYSGSNNGGWSSNYTPNSTSWTSPTASGTQARCTRIVVTYTPSAATYSVTYNLNGGTGTTPTETNKEKDATFDLHNGTTGITPPSCKTFSKWKDQDNNEFNGGATYTMPAKNVTLTAQWVDVPLYTVSFSTGAEAQTQTTCGGSILLPTPTVSSACSALGWSFAGWSESNSDYSSLKKDTYIPTSNITLYAVYKKSEDEGGTSTIILTNNQIRLGRNGNNNYQDSYNIEGWTGKYAVNLDKGNYSLQIGRNTDSSKGAYNSHITTPTLPTGAIITSITLIPHTSWTTNVGRTFYLMNTNTLNYTAASNQSNDFGTGSCVSDNSPVIITTTNSPSQFHIYADGTTYLDSIILTYSVGSTEYSFNPVCETVHVDTVTLPVDTIRIRINDTYELTPTVLPSNATNKNVSWVSTMPGIATVENGVVTGVAEGTAAAIVVTEDGNKYAACVVIVLGNANIDVVEWNPDWLKIDVENFTAATATLEDQNTQADIEINYADSVFFSKYFEAASNVKLLGIYNGTNHDIDISSYKFALARNGGSFESTAFSSFVRKDGEPFNTIIPSCTELILIAYHYDDKSDSVIIQCAIDNPHSGYANYVRISTPAIDFNGDDAIALVNPSNNFIDLIGAGTKAGGAVKGTDFRSCNKSGAQGGDCDGFMDSPGGWFNADGINVETNDSNYALATNRCLLVRKKRVKSGLDAVAKNTTTFVTLGGTYGEWRGLQMPGGSPNTADGEGTRNSCSGFDDVGTFDYNDYYIDYDTIYEETPFDGQEDDGYYKIEIPNLDALSCTNLKITVKDESSNELEKIVKIPIMIKTNTTTDDDDYFDKKDCDKCDVVVLKDKTLTVAGTTSANRDMKLYEGAELRVPTSTSYTINSLAFRRYNDTVSSLKLDGTLTVNKVYFDLYITPDDWHYISLPDTFIVSNVKYTNGKSPRYGTDCLAKYYDGEYRSQNYKGGWKSVPAGMKFNPGNGFTFGLSDAFKKKEFRFELNPNVITYEKTNKNVIDLHAWGITTEGLRPNHIGWNLIGNPFMGHFEAEIYNKIRVDSLVKVIENSHWTGQWELSNTTRGKSLRYAVIPSKAPEDKAAGGYKSVVLDDMKLLPFTCFFVQLGDNGNGEGAQGIEFKSSRIINRVVARNSQEEEDDELFLRVKVDDWKTGMFISSQFSEEYEPGDDLESRYPIYQNLGGYKLLYSAINDSIIESGVTITAPQGRLYLDPKVDVDRFEYIYVNYNNNWYGLMHGEAIDIEAGTFILSAKRKVKDNTATDIDYIPTNGLYKFTDGKNIYINKNNTIFNVLGNKIR